MDVSQIFFDGWEGIVYILLSAPIIYVSTILFIRLSGKRSTSQMNNFDWVVTVALGSIIASGIILDNISITETLLASAVLLSMQWLLTQMVLRKAWVRSLVKADPRLLVHKGEFIEDAMRDERVTSEEIMAAIREEGLTKVEEVQWVILENDATFSIIPAGDHDFSSTELEGVEGFPSKGDYE